MVQEFRIEYMRKIIDETRTLRTEYDEISERLHSVYAGNGTEEDFEDMIERREFITGELAASASILADLLEQVLPEGKVE